MIELTSSKLILKQNLKPYYTGELELDLEAFEDKKAIEGKDIAYAEIGRQIVKQFRDRRTVEERLVDGGEE